MDDFLKKAVVNYLFYRQNMSIDDAYNLYYANLESFKKMYEIFGEDFLDGVLKYINKEKS